MKKYRRILAGFLAMNLTISMASTNMIRVNADEAYQEETYTAEPEQTYAEEDQGEVVEGNDSSQALSGGEDASGWITEGEETIQETDAPTAEPETSGDDIQEEPTSEADYGDEVSILNIEEMEPDESAVQAATQTAGTLSIKQFNTYKDDGNGKKSVVVKNGTELILLSNCKPEELQDVTINLNITSCVRCDIRSSGYADRRSGGSRCGYGGRCRSTGYRGDHRRGIRGGSTGTEHRQRCSYRHSGRCSAGLHLSEPWNGSIPISGWNHWTDSDDQIG